MDEKGTDNSGVESNKKIIGYRIDDGAIVVKGDKYRFAKEGVEQKLGPTLGPLLWLLVSETFENPGEWVRKEKLWDLVASKEALKENIHRIKKYYIGDAIQTKRNEGYRVEAKIEPIYEDELESSANGELTAETASAPGETENVSIGTENPLAAIDRARPWVTVWPRPAVMAVSLLLVIVFSLSAGLLVLQGVLKQARQDYDSLKNRFEQSRWERVHRIEKPPKAPEDEGKANMARVWVPTHYSIGPIERDAKNNEHQIQFKKGSDALSLTIFEESDYSQFQIEIFDTAKKQLMARTLLGRDEHGNLTIIIDRNLFTSKAYLARIYPIGKENLMKQYRLRIIEPRN